MYEHLRNDLSVKLAELNGVDIDKVLIALDTVMSNYEVHRKETSLTVYNGELPAIVKTYLVCKKMSGLSDNTLESYLTMLSLFFKEVRKLPQYVTTNDIRLFLYAYHETRKCSFRSLDKYREYLARFFA